MPPVAPQTIHLKPSRRLLLIQLAAHLVGGAAVLASSIPGWTAALLLVLVGYSLARQRNAELPTSLILRDAGRFEKVGADSTVTEGVVHPHTMVIAPLVVLLYREKGRIKAMALASDSLSQDDARELRLWLRWRVPAVPPR
ncbi:MAG: hypothetical protein HZA62_15500 [Rhodocyclales bacterium]|nr:hypothetical protein [Rhodocyclales bacterium]